jgi:hypothetical protein
LAEVLDAEGGWEAVVGEREADFFVSFAAGGVQGGFDEVVCFACLIREYMSRLGIRLRGREWVREADEVGKGSVYLLVVLLVRRLGDEISMEPWNGMEAVYTRS